MSKQGRWKQISCFRCLIDNSGLIKGLWRVLVGGTVFSPVFLGVSDFNRAVDFHTPLMACLGLSLRFCDPSKSWAAWQRPEQPRPLFIIGRPYDQAPASVATAPSWHLLRHRDLWLMKPTTWYWLMELFQWGHLACEHITMNIITLRICAIWKVINSVLSAITILSLANWIWLSAPLK